MNIVTEKETNGRLPDGINTLLTLSEEDFQKVIDLLQIDKIKFPDDIRFFYSTDPCEAPNNAITLGLENLYNSRYYFGAVPSMPQIFEALSLRAVSDDGKSKESSRSKAILETRNVEALKKLYLNDNEDNKEIIDRLFEILENPDILRKFLDYDNNSEYFSVGEKGAIIQDYFRELGNIFGNIGENGDLKGRKKITNSFYISNLDSIIQSVKDIYQKFNTDRYVNPRYEFKRVGITEEVIRTGDEPEWNINPALYDAIYKDMPENLSLEEKAFYIYTKLCLVLEYNEEYLYRDKGISSSFEDDFSKGHLEEIVPGSKITCYDFSRIFAKMINEIDGDIEAVIISEGANRGHFSTGFYTDKISVKLEAININLNGRKDPTNDLMKAKNGIKLRGITVISDKEGIIDSSMDRVYESIYGKQALSVKSFVNELKNLPKTEVIDDIKAKLQSFIDVMRQKGITGNEFVQTLDGMCKANFFGDEVEKAYLGKRIEHDGEKHIQRMVLFRQKGKEQQEEPSFYLIDTSTLEMAEPSAQQLIENLNSGSVIYESKEHKIAGIDKEADDDTAK